MKTRMQPIGNVWGKFPRVVRDLASPAGKQVRIEMDGRETELDKTIIEAIKDPFDPSRSATPSTRHRDARCPPAAGKPAEGRLFAGGIPRERPGQHRDSPTTAPGSDVGSAFKRKAVRSGVIVSLEHAERM